LFLNKNIARSLYTLV